MKDRFYFGLLSLFLFIFISTHFFLWVSFLFIFLLHFFSSIFAFLLLTHISQRGELNTFWNSIFSHICLSASGIWSLIAREEISLRLCPPMWKVILGRDIEGNLSGSKGVTMDNFSISVKGWWKMVISHLKHSYLNWRANPYRGKRLQFFIFSNFFFEFGFLDFHLDSIEFFKCMTWQSIFLFSFFFFLFCFFFFLFSFFLLSFSWFVYSRQRRMP